MAFFNFFSILACLGMLLLAACSSTPPTRPAMGNLNASSSATSSQASAPFKSAITGFKAVDWQQIAGWQTDDLRQAWPAWLKSCEALRKRKSELQWAQVCSRAETLAPQDTAAIRRYFENYFQAYETWPQARDLEKKSTEI